MSRRTKRKLLKWGPLLFGVGPTPWLLVGATASLTVVSGALSIVLEDWRTIPWQIASLCWIAAASYWRAKANDPSNQGSSQ